MADVLPTDLVVVYQDAFAEFDTEKNGIISTKMLGPLLRHCGENPSEAEVQVNVNGSKTVDLNFFFCKIGNFVRNVYI